MEEEISLELIDKWKIKYKATMEEVVELGLKADPKADVQALKEEYMLGTMASIYVSCLSLKQQIKELEKKLAQ